MKPAILSALAAAALSFVPFTAARSQEADCPNFWYNPRTGQSECLGGTSSPAPQPPTTNPAAETTGTAPNNQSSIDRQATQIYERLSIGISYREVVRNVGQPSHRQIAGQSCQWQGDLEATFIGGKFASGSFLLDGSLPQNLVEMKQRFGEPLSCESVTRYTWKWKQGSYQCGIGVDIQQDRVTSKSKICWNDADISTSEAAEMGF